MFNQNIFRCFQNFCFSVAGFWKVSQKLIKSLWKIFLCHMLNPSLKNSPSRRKYYLLEYYKQNCYNCIICWEKDISKKRFLMSYTFCRDAEMICRDVKAIHDKHLKSMYLSYESKLSLGYSSSKKLLNCMFRFVFVCTVCKIINSFNCLVHCISNVRCMVAEDARPQPSA